MSADELGSYSPDVVIAQRLSFNSKSEIDSLVGKCRRLGAALIFEIDDDLLSIAGDHSEYAHYQSAASGVRSLAAQADEVWVSTARLADVFSPLNKKTIVFQNALEPRIWRRPIGPRGGSTVRILYMGTVSHSGDFREIFLPAFQKLRSELGDGVEATIIGVMPDLRSSPGLGSLGVPSGIGGSYPAFVHWLQEACHHDVGVAPLTDSPFNQSKSHIKWLEYSALGMATVASPIGEYRASIKHHHTGVLAGVGREGFYIALREAVMDRGLREDVTRHATTMVSQNLVEASKDVRRLSRLACITGLELGGNLL